MKPVVIFIILSGIMCSNVTAQKMNTYLTLHGGFASAKGYEAKLSSGLGLDVEIRIKNRAHLNLRPTVNFRGYNGSSLVSTIKVTYIDLPVNIEVDLDDNPNHVFIGAGPYIGFAIGGKYKNNLTTSGNTSWQKINFGEGLTDNRSPVDYGFNLNAGALLRGHKRNFKVGVQSQIGLKNVVPEERQNTTNTFEINLRNFTAYIAVGLSTK